MLRIQVLVVCFGPLLKRKKSLLSKQSSGKIHERFREGISAYLTSIHNLIDS